MIWSVAESSIQHQLNCRLNWPIGDDDHQGQPQSLYLVEVVQNGPGGRLDLQGHRTAVPRRQYIEEADSSIGKTLRYFDVHSTTLRKADFLYVRNHQIVEWSASHYCRVSLFANSYSLNASMPFPVISNRRLRRPLLPLSNSWIRISPRLTRFSRIFTAVLVLILICFGYQDDGFNGFNSIHLQNRYSRLSPKTVLDKSDSSSAEEVCIEP